MNPTELAQTWFDAFAAPAPAAPTATVVTRANGWGEIVHGRAYEGPLTLNGNVYGHGLCAHVDSEALLVLPGPGARLRCFAGVDHNPCTAPAKRLHRKGRILFAVTPKGGATVASPARSVDDPPFAFDIPLNGATEVVLAARAEDGVLQYGHADWAALTVTLADGAEIPVGFPPARRTAPTAPPFSFRYGGVPVELSTWERREETATVADGARRLVTWRDPDTGLACRAEATLWSGDGAVEWVVWFENQGGKDTPLLEEVWPLDALWGHIGPATLDRMTGERTRGRRQGNPDGAGDFEMESLRLKKPADAVRMNPGEGRSSNEWMPYFNLREPDRGLIAAVGWTGLWGASFAPETDDGVRMKIGLDRTRLTLRPGEHIRTPRVLLQFWDAPEPRDGHNAFRRTMRAHYSPRGSDGEIMTPPICEFGWGGMETAIHQKTIRHMVEHRLDYDYYWIDAGWFGVGEKNIPELEGSPWWRQVGDWTVNRVIYPDGMMEVADAVHAAGAKFLLWCEPERAMADAPAVVANPRLFLRAPDGGDSLLLNLASPAGRDYLIDLIDNLIRENGIDCYRQDFNTNPLPYWRAADAADRVGYTESKHIEHLYAFLDELRRRHPDLLIDNCASGGRRLDFEMAARGVPLWRSDHQCFPGFDLSVAQTQLYGLSHWLPLHGTGAHTPAGDNYQLRSNYGTSLSMGSNGPDFPYDWQRRAIAEFKRVRAFILHGDYHPLAGGTSAADRWQVVSFTRPDTREAVVLAFRREESPFTAATFRLRGLDAGKTYTIENADTGATVTRAGRELMDTGLAIELPAPRSSALLFLR